MEHAQRGAVNRCYCAVVRVLILILMEHAQRVYVLSSYFDMVEKS